VTHGEPHSANFIAGTGGELHLIDWDTVRLAPPERDLAVLGERHPRALAAYQATAGPLAPRKEMIKLFETRWTLEDICLYVRQLRRPHTGSSDDRAAWENLKGYLDTQEAVFRASDPRKD
jgi:spectinomycin phosphotransferase